MVWENRKGSCKNKPDVPPQVAAPDMPQVHAADGDAAGALRRRRQPVQQMHQRALAGAGAAQHGEGLSLPDGEGHVLQDRLPLVAEGHMVKHNVPAGEGNVIGLILLLRGAEDVAHTVHGYPRPCSYPTAPGPENARATPGDSL